MSFFDSALVSALFPTTTQKVSILPAFPKDRTSGLLEFIYQTQEFQYNFELQFNNKIDIPSRNDYSVYLQRNNQRVKELAYSIVSPGDSSDVKAEKITAWVIDNIDYQSDEQTYKQSEYWALPTQTISNGVGDCEDGAFLIHSLLLAAGVRADRLRTYGGLVVAGEGAATGGHGWTAYKRETDDEWVVLDFSYYPTKDPVSERPLMKKDNRYIDDFFYISKNITVDTPFADRIHNPDSYVPGNYIDTYA